MQMKDPVPQERQRKEEKMSSAELHQILVQCCDSLSWWWVNEPVSTKAALWREPHETGRGALDDIYIYMAGVQNSRSKGSYKVGPIGIEKLILHLRYEAGPIGNHAVPKLGASIALAWR